MKTKVSLYTLGIFLFFLPFLIRHFFDLPLIFTSDSRILTPHFLSLGIEHLSEYVPLIFFYLILSLGVIWSFIFVLQKFELSKEFFLFLILFMIFVPTVNLAFLKLDVSIIVLPLLVFVYVYRSPLFFGILTFIFPPAGFVALFFMERKLLSTILFCVSVLFFSVLENFLGLGYELFSFTSPISFLELGEFGGMSLFVFFCALVGFSQSWQKSKYTNIGPFIIIIIGFFIPGLYVYASIICAYYASVFVTKLYLTDWVNSFLKVSCIILVYFFVILLYALFVESTLLQSPSITEKAEFESLNYNNGIFFTHPDSAYALNAFENITVPIYTDSEYEIIYYGTNMNQTLQLLLRENVTHILITFEMKNGEIWNSSSSGLLFLLKDENVFFKIPSEHYDLYFIRYQNYVEDS
jgi:hypothetical protein